MQAGENPVKKIPIIVTGIEAEVHIDEIEELPIGDVGGAGGGGADGGGAGGAAAGGGNNNYVRAMYSQVIGLRRELQETREEMNRLSDRNYQQQQQINRSVRRIALQPVQRRQNNQQLGGGALGGQGVNTATLSRNPRTLFILWQEFEFGIGGRKPAKDFTAIERGRSKYAYHRRKVVWERISV